MEFSQSYKKLSSCEGVLDGWPYVPLAFQICLGDCLKQNIRSFSFCKVMNNRVHFSAHHENEAFQTNSLADEETEASIQEKELVKVFVTYGVISH